MKCVLFLCDFGQGPCGCCKIVVRILWGLNCFEAIFVVVVRFLCGLL